MIFNKSESWMTMQQRTDLAEHEVNTCNQKTIYKKIKIVRKPQMQGYEV